MTSYLPNSDDVSKVIIDFESFLLLSTIMPSLVIIGTHIKENVSPANILPKSLNRVKPAPIFMIIGAIITIRNKSYDGGDLQSDPEAKVIPKIRRTNDYMLYKTYCVILLRNVLIKYKYL